MNKEGTVYLLVRCSHCGTWGIDPIVLQARIALGVVVVETSIVVDVLHLLVF